MKFGQMLNIHLEPTGRRQDLNNFNDHSNRHAVIHVLLHQIKLGLLLSAKPKVLQSDPQSGIEVCPSRNLMPDFFFNLPM